MRLRAASHLIFSLLLCNATSCALSGPSIPKAEPWSAQSPPIVLQIDPVLRAMEHPVGEESFAVGESVRAALGELLRAGQLEWSESAGPVPLGKAHLKLQALLTRVEEQSPYTVALFELNWRLMSSRGAELAQGRIRAEGQSAGELQQAWSKAAEAALTSLQIEARRELAPALAKLNENQP